MCSMLAQNNQPIQSGIYFTLRFLFVILLALTCIDYLTDRHLSSVPETIYIIRLSKYWSILSTTFNYSF